MLVSALVLAAPVAAQAVPNGAEANDTVQIVKSSLMGIAIGLLILTIFYWIHTDPKRRARAHSKKQARKAAYAESRQPEAVASSVAEESIHSDGIHSNSIHSNSIDPESIDPESIDGIPEVDDAVVELVDDEFELPEVEREVS